MLIKITIRYHLIPSRMVIIKKQKKKREQVLVRLWRKGNPCTLLVECKLVQPLWKTVWSFLKKLKIELQHDPAIPFLGIYPKEISPKYTPKKSFSILKDTCNPLFTAVLFTIAKIWKQPKCPLTDEWMKKLWGICFIYIHMYYMYMYYVLYILYIIFICIICTMYYICTNIIIY